MQSEPSRKRALIAWFVAAAVLLGGVGAAALLAPGIGGAREPNSAAEAPGNLATFVAWGTPVEMEENDRVINVTPRVTIDPRGGYLVADGREAQVRRYHADGRLAQVIGRKGNGPGEFQNLVGVHRLHDGRIVAVEMGGKVSVFDEGGKKLLQTRPSGLAPLYETAVLEGHTLLLAGRRMGEGETALVHVYDVDKGALGASFFQIPGHHPDLVGGYMFAGSSDVVTRGDTVAAVFALSDSIYLFDSRGTSVGRVAIPFARFRRLTRPMPTSGANLEDFRKWTETFSAISHLYWLRDGSFLVQYYDMKGVEPQWRLLHMSREGQLRFEGVDTPKLLATGGGGDGNELVFVHPAAEAPNQWVSARLRP
jgi:hypothetical protein